MTITHTPPGTDVVSFLEAKLKEEGRQPMSGPPLQAYRDWVAKREILDAYHEAQTFGLPILPGAPDALSLELLAGVRIGLGRAVAILASAYEDKP